MRQIKFRAQDIASNKWLYGDLRYHKDDICIFEQEGNNGEQVKRDTVGQYTGLHDRKDREIYEGDILFVEFADNSGGNQLVGWNEETASWGIMSTYEYQSLMEGDDWPEFKNHTLLSFLEGNIVCEVVGNIHDNPELMNVPNKKD